MDELLVAADVEAMLIELGCEVVDPTVAEVERMAAAKPLDWVLLDVNLRGQQSSAPCPALQARNINVVLSMGYQSPALFPPAFRQLPILGKPYDRAELAALLRAACGLRDPT